MYKEIKTKIISDDVSIDIKQMPEHELDHLCTALLEAAQKYFENPANREKYEKWRAERKKEKDDG